MRGRRKKHSLWLPFVPALIAALGASHAVFAQDKGAPPTASAPAEEAPMEELAQKHYEDGQAAVARGDFQAAYTSFRAGFAVQPHSQMIRALGDAAYHLGKSRDAAEFLALYLQKAPSTAPVGERAAAEQMLTDAKTRVGSLQITAPVGAEVFVDKAFVGKAPLDHQVYVEPGTCEIEARAGDQYGQQRIQTTKGTLSAVTLVFGIVAPPLPSASASAGPTGTAPKPPPPSGPNMGVVIAGAAVGGAAVVAGAVLMGLSAGKASDEQQAIADLRASGTTNVCVGNSPDPRCKAVIDAAASADLWRNAGGWLLIGGVAVGAATGLYALLTRPPSDPAAPNKDASAASDKGPRKARGSVKPPEIGAVITPQGGGGTLTVRW